jgi:hypothetical protein
MKRTVKYLICFVNIIFLFAFISMSFAEITAVGKSKGKYIYKFKGVFIAVSEGDVIDGCLVTSSGLVCDNQLKIDIESHDYCSKQLKEALAKKPCDCSGEINEAVKNMKQRCDNKTEIELIKAKEDCLKDIAEVRKQKDCSQEIIDAGKDIGKRCDNKIQIELVKYKADCAKNILEAVQATEQKCSNDLDEYINNAEQKLAEEKKEAVSQASQELSDSKDYKIKALKEALRRCWNSKSDANN